MADPITFPSRTERLGLPLLFAGQAQKEFFLNQALCLLDALMSRAVTGSLAMPPAEPAEGSCFRILDAAVGEWAGQDRSIAVRIGGGWHFVSPHPGMQVFDRTSGCWYHFDENWIRPTRPAAPDGGTVIDHEARAVLTQLLDTLHNIGSLASETG